MTDSVAQNSYYSSVEGLQKVELKRALHDMMQPERVLSYGSKKGHTWEGFWQADRIENNKIRDRYSNEDNFFNPEDTCASNPAMNIEHIWANSWWGHEENEAYCDLFNLYPAEKYANIAKSNNPIGVVTSNVDYDNGSIKRGMSNCYRPDSLIKVWEPADKWKGDFARTYFYMATCYTELKDLWTTTEGWLTADMSEWPTMRPWVYNLMLQWARQDPVDSIEIQRNDVIYCIQGNRNPFVDLPQLCEYIWGTMVDSAFHADAVIIDPIVIPVDTIETEIADFFEDFEKGTKGSYAVGDVVCTASSWTMSDALLGGFSSGAADHYYDKKCVRIRNGYIEMTEDYGEGCDSLSFYAGMYGSTPSGANLSVFYSMDEGETWIPLVESMAMGSWQQYAYEMDVKGTIRLRFVCDGGGEGGTYRINIDNIRMTPYQLLLGDVNGDKQISIADVTSLVNIVLGKTTTYNTKVADVNGDGVISIADVTALVNIILGK